jgi:hypothetical protein
MKNLITSIACIMILLVFVLQFTQNQVIHNRISAVDQAVNSFKEVVKQEGCITKDNEDELKGEIVGILNCSENEVEVDGDRRPVYRGSRIHYIVTVPVEGIITAAAFWAISDDEDRFYYTTDRYTTSEYIGRDGR